MFHARSHGLQGAGTLVLRVVVGIVLIAHGLQKALGFDAWADNVRQLGIPLPDVMAGLAMGAELGGGALLLLGLLTPIAALFVLVTMLVAIVKVHLPNGLFAADGGFELPMVLAGTALFFLLHGAGPYSVDAWIAERARGGEHRRRGRPEAGRPEAGPAPIGAFRA